MRVAQELLISLVGAATTRVPRSGAGSSKADIILMAFPFKVSRVSKARIVTIRIKVGFDNKPRILSLVLRTSPSLTSQRRSQRSWSRLGSIRSRNRPKEGWQRSKNIQILNVRSLNTRVTKSSRLSIRCSPLIIMTNLLSSWTRSSRNLIREVPWRMEDSNNSRKTWSSIPPQK